MKVTLCLLVKNEIQGCKETLPKIPFSYFDDVFAIDGQSSDGTEQFLIQSGIRTYRQNSKTYNGAYIEALSNFSTDAIIFFHPKGTVEPVTLIDAINLLKEGNSFVVGSRMVKNAQNEEDLKIIRTRKWFSWLLSHVASLKWKKRKQYRITDPLHGFRGFNKTFANSLNLIPQGETADLEMVKHCYSMEFKSAEFGVIENPRSYGSTNFPAIKTGRKLIKYLFTESN